MCVKCPEQTNLKTLRADRRLPRARGWRGDDERGVTANGLGVLGGWGQSPEIRRRWWLHNSASVLNCGIVYFKWASFMAWELSLDKAI